MLMKPSDALMRVVDVQSVTTTGSESVTSGFPQLQAQRDDLYRALALAVGNTSLAAEAVDEAMTRALERWEVVSRYESPEGWVYRVGLNWARSVHRKRIRENLWSNPPDEVTLDKPTDLDLRSAISRLPVNLRSVVVVRYLLDWSTSQTAEALGIPEATVKTQLRRALARLANDLGGPES